ncbi:sodium bicarbonate cotransporter 3-like [Lingula anatina]|uniref:Anion exchange protein n=1 Tax=Lingula anatina TaxID=7574 RepID=A0A1S3HXJ9_LINAN|nr:sodium bicarbonate cotransporter 3-like [Lingula anatina]|eukprot:XP_013390286.1 sodium bicarbonate cotransporter 3-like [Lingula anatina]
MPFFLISKPRWVKFEEDVELDGGKWSKPRVATLQMNQLRTFRDLLAEGAYLQDLDGNTFPEVVDSLVERLSRAVPENISEEKLKDVLLRKHHHQHEKKPSYSLANFKRSLSTTKSEEASASNGDRRLFSRSESTKTDGTDPEDPESFGTDGDDVFKDSDEIYKPNQNFMRKIPKGAEVCNILVGNVDFLPNPLCCFCRLSNASILGDMTEVPLPTRFIFLLLGPARDPESSYHDLGRAMGALMCDEVFQECAYKAHNMQELVDGVDEFIDSTTVLPSSEWNPAIRVEPPQNIPSQAKRKKKMKKNMIGRRRSSVASAIYFKARRFSSLLDEDDDEEEEVPGHADPTLIRTGRPFGGLVDDFKRKIRWYLSDFRDAIHYKCLAPFIFLYFALLTSNVTFGGLLTEGTHSHLGNIENILGAAICGATYALFSGQPLTIISSTGPMLIFEKVYYKFCNDRGWDYLESRVWVGLWISIILLVIVAFDLSALVRYITKFTEESFAMLISLIFIFEAFEKTVSISDHYPVHMHTERAQKHECYCLHPNMTDAFNSSDIYTSLHLPFNCTFNPGEDDFDHLPHGPECMNRPIVSMFECTADGGVLHGPGCFEEKFVENVFFFSVLLFLGTFIIAWKLKQFRASNYFPSKVRSVVSDFAVPIALAIMIGADRIVSIDTPKLNVPSKIQPTYENRTSWIVNPLTENNPWWLALAAILPAALATILIFLDQQITAVIVNRKENKLKKGRGYHLDLFVLAVQIGLCSIFGLPWFVAATVESLTHVDSLKEESECTAPGEKPKFLGVREQRVTGFFIFVLIGCSVFLSGFLQYVPMPVLYGVFLYMGVCALKGKELMQRIRIIFMPQKYQPDYMFLRHVKTKRIHIFTLIQVVCLALLWVVKMVKIISIAFPLMVLAMCVVRIVLLDRVFNQRELLWLDDILPGKEVTTEDWEEKGGRSSDSESVDTKEINQNTKLEGDAMV